jgi:hypothetical protein
LVRICSTKEEIQKLDAEFIEDYERPETALFLQITSYELDLKASYLPQFPTCADQATATISPLLVDSST